MGKDQRHEEVTLSGGKAPSWSLDDLFPSKNLDAAFEKISSDVREFCTAFQGRVTKLSGAQLGCAIAQYETIIEQMDRISAFAYLSVSADHKQSTWAENVQERLRQHSEKIIFFPLEINKIKEADLLEKFSAPELSRYGSWIGTLRSFRDHQLEDAVEAFIHKKTPVAEGVWSRLYDMTMADMSFTVRGEKLTVAEVSSIINDAQDPALRREAWVEFTSVLGQNAATFALITNATAALKKVGDSWRGFESPDDSRHLSNQIEPAVVTAMVDAVRDGYPKTSHRYYAWKARKFGVARLHPSDRAAPLPDAPDGKLSWDDAKNIVLRAFEKLSPDMAAIAKDFFDKGWIDAEPRQAKESGAFSHPTVPSAHPYILMNFFGSKSDVMTLAHELGHGVHQVMAGAQGHLKSDTPLTLAETASIFGEMLAFKELLSAEEDLIAKRALIAAKVEDMLNTVARQTAFFTFEKKVHEERRDKGELPPARINDIWLETQKESLGPAVNMDVAGAENLWMSIPHFIHSPFYVYAYAFGDCLVNALFDEYEKAVDKTAFVEKYITLLQAGGTRRHDAALAEFGLDCSDPKFWKKGLSVIERYIDQLEALDVKIEQILAAKGEFKQAANDIANPPPRIDSKQAGGPKAP